MLQRRADTYRLYPTPEQADGLARTVGRARFVSTWALRPRSDAYAERQERRDSADTSAALTAVQRGPETAWLDEGSSVPTQRARRHLDHASRECFAGRAE